MKGKLLGEVIFELLHLGIDALKKRRMRKQAEKAQREEVKPLEP